MILRLFGATVTPLTKVRSTVEIDRPWNLSIGARTAIGDKVIIRAMERVSIGDRCTVSQLALITTEMRDPRDPRGVPLHGPITIEDDGWVASDALVLPGTSVRRGTIIGARSTAAGDLPSWHIAVGEPAKPLRQRRIRSVES